MENFLILKSFSVKNWDTQESFPIKYKGAGATDNYREALYMIERGQCPFSGSMIESRKISKQINSLFLLENGDVKVVF